VLNTLCVAACLSNHTSWTHHNALQLQSITMDNTSANGTLCETVQHLHESRNTIWNAVKNQLMCVLTPFANPITLFRHSRCLGHVVNLGNIDIMSHITKIAAVETTSAIWEYDPDLPGNRILGGSLDVIAAIRVVASV
jgi:hypothetical protein